MGSFIDIGAVQSHLVSAGHKMTSQEVAQLLNDLGFTTPKEDPFKHAEPSIDTQFNPIISQPFQLPHMPPPSYYTHPEELPISSSHSNDGITALASKLDELEEQLNAINNAQERVTEYWGEERIEEEEIQATCATCGCHCSQPGCTPVMHSSVLLGPQAQQLQDWAQVRLPNLANFNGLSSRNENRIEKPSHGMPSRQSMTRLSPTRKLPQGSKRGIKSDPVARYR